MVKYNYFIGKDFLFMINFKRIQKYTQTHLFQYNNLKPEFKYTCINFPKCRNGFVIINLFYDNSGNVRVN